VMLRISIDEAASILYGHYLSRQLVLPSPAPIEFLIPELPVSGIYWTCYPELFSFLLTCNFVM